MDIQGKDLAEEFARKVFNCSFTGPELVFGIAPRTRNSVLYFLGIFSMLIGTVGMGS